MTLYEKIKGYTVEELAEFIYGLCEGTEERLLESLDRQGVGASLVRLAPEVRIAENVTTLLQEVPDDDT